MSTLSYQSLEIVFCLVIEMIVESVAEAFRESFSRKIDALICSMLKAFYVSLEKRSQENLLPNAPGWHYQASTQTPDKGSILKVFDMIEDLSCALGILK